MIFDNNALSLEDKIFSILEEEILSGKLKSGDKLKEQALSERLGASRTPIRAALLRLADEGLISFNTNRSATVVGVTENDVADIYKIRIRLEGLASGLAAARISEEEKKQLSDSVELSEFYLAKQDAEHLKELDTEFHSIIYKASGNRLLSHILLDLHRNIKAYRKLSLSDPKRVSETVKEHREILDAIIASDEARADELTSLHITRAMENLLNNINKKQED